MTRSANAPALKVVATNGQPKAEPDARAQLRLTRALARAMARYDKLEAALRAANAEVDAAFGPWAAGRTIARDEAREQLTSTGYLPRRRIWQ